MICMKHLRCYVILAGILMSFPMALFSRASNDKHAVVFDLNYEGSVCADTLFVTPGCMMQQADRRQQERAGYRFAGWYTSKECQPEQEWLFGSKNGGYYPPVRLDSMAVTRSMRLYARWVKPVSITTAEQFDSMRKDLHGWYVLDADIDLSAYKDWQPIGEYESDCEMADGEWWKKAFKGNLDGQGHKIHHLNLTTGNPIKKALFGAIANGEVCNLVIEDCRINLQAPTVYVAPLVGIMKQDGGRVATVQNCEVRNLMVKVGLNMQTSNFSGVTGLIAGAWNGTIEHCTVAGDISVDVEGNGGGELYIGGILGEGYSDTKGCHSDMNIQANIQGGGQLKIFIGGLQASATNVTGSLSTGRIEVTGNNGIKEMYIGGLVGSQRYGDICYNASQSDITIRNASVAQIGGIVGEFNKTYGSIGTAFGVSKTTVTKCYASGKVKTDHVDSLAFGNISGSGQPEPLAGWFGKGMSYLVTDCAYLNQHIADAVDATINSLKGFDSIGAMKGETLKEILGTTHWIYVRKGRPIPKKRISQ